MSEPPVFKVRKSTTGLTWVVEIIWDGQTEAIDGFASKKGQLALLALGQARQRRSESAGS
jgi:hypothetical protein